MSRTLMKWSLLAAFLLAAGLGCSEDNAGDGTDSSTSTTLSIEGSLGGSGAASLKLGALAVTDYKVRCVTLEGTPKAGEGDVNSDGSFSFNIAGVSNSDNVPVGCFIINKSTSAIAATVAFDSGSEGMGGGNAASGSINATGGEGVDFGEINFDADKGTATVPVSQISRSGNSRTTTGTFADVTGNWLLECVDSDDYDCPEEAEQGQFVVFLNQVQANDDESDLHTGLAIWENEATYNSCGQTEDLDSVLPAGWTAVDADMNDDFDFSAVDFANLPAASDVSTNFAVCNDSTANTCDEVENGGTAEGTNNADGWGAPGGGQYSDADCQAICRLNAIHDSDINGCVPRIEVDWGETSSANLNDPGELAAELATLNDGNTTNGLISAGDSPEGRFVLGELITDGKVGTVLDSDSFTEHVCIDNGDNTGCTDRECVMTENVRVTVTQASSTSAVVEVLINRALDEGNSHPDCTDESKDGNEFIIEDLERSEKFLMTGTKQ